MLVSAGIVKEQIPWSWDYKGLWAQSLDPNSDPLQEHHILLTTRLVLRAKFINFIASQGNHREGEKQGG